jgi:glycosyltransferase involved in cell wall biosynthesis
LNAESVEKFKLDYVGDGVERPKIKLLYEKNKSESEVYMWGNLSRVEVVNKLDESDCFIMISKGETFGLVYLEAMSRGLITIASRNEGMDGIIIDGQNGFFCNAGDYQDLSKVLNRINHLSNTERNAISRNAILTAKSFSDRRVAEIYLSAITTS